MRQEHRGDPIVMKPRRGVFRAANALRRKLCAEGID
jgi:hypothetical protein